MGSFKQIVSLFDGIEEAVLTAAEMSSKKPVFSADLTNICRNRLKIALLSGVFLPSGRLTGYSKRVKF